MAPSSRALALIASLLAVAALVFIATRPDSVTDSDVTAEESTSPSAEPSGAADPSSSSSPTKKPKPKPTKKPVDRAKTFVVIFNNTPTKGLASGVAAKTRLAGWNVVGADNWYGTIDTTTVYYPPKMKRAASLLAKDLGIGSVKPSVQPMKLDRLTVILTGDYSD